MIRAVLLDLDGVIRHFDPSLITRIEERYGIDEGRLIGAAFAPSLLASVTTGVITRAEWLRRIGDELGNAGAAAEWGELPSEVDREMLVLSEKLRASGIRTAILTNGTETIPDEMRNLGIEKHFDAVFNSAEIGHAKPDVRAFQYALKALGCDPAEVLFIDDSASKLAGATELGMPTHHFTDIEGLRSALRDAGVPQSAIS